MRVLGGGVLTVGQQLHKIFVLDASHLGNPIQPLLEEPYHTCTYGNPFGSPYSNPYRTLMLCEPFSNMHWCHGTLSGCQFRI